LANIYFLQSQLNSKSLLFSNFKEVCYDSNGNFVHLEMEDFTSVSDYVKQWSMYLENVDYLDIPKFCCQGRMQSVFSALKDQKKMFSKTEESQLGTDIFKITFLLAYICDFLEKKLLSLSDYKSRIHNDIEYIIQAEKDCDIQNSSEDYENILSSVELNYEQLISSEYEILHEGIIENELDSIKTISNELGLPENINYSKLDSILDSIDSYKLALEENFLKRKYGINNPDGKRNCSLKLIFPYSNTNGDDEDEQ